ncbi:hypothetical protein M434DRAFT_35587 [Hypoxylon sp. CO27-5]|nr:hypothetical protein M434DRAFT_35587 [Hypoxylon sp. CO27-5]
MSEDGHAIALESKGRQGKVKFPHGNNKELGMLGTIPLRLLQPLRDRTPANADIQDTDNYTLLSCWTMASDLYLPGRLIPLGRHSKRWPDSEHLAIFNGKREWIGCILMNKIWIDAHLDKTRPYRFILISRSEDILLYPDPDVTFFDTNLFQYRPWCFLNVMMVEDLDGTARRLGIGIVHEDAWLQENPIKTLVKLN